MEENKILYSNEAISIATFLGGPLAAGYLFKKNYEAFSQEEKGRKAFFIGLISTVLIFVGVFFIPDDIKDKIPGALIPAFYTLMIHFIFEKTQGGWLKEHKESGGKFHSGWKAIKIGVVSLVILLSSIMGIVFVADVF
ncbi:MAG: hypothetical protein ACEPOW_06095 [Bacteroidales bacterium]